MPSIQVHHVDFHVLPTRTRFPFRYGIAAMTEAPHWFVACELEIDGKPARGIASEGLPPKWFTKNPETTFEEDDLPGMERVIRHAARTAEAIGKPLSFFDFWETMRQEQERWARTHSIPPLLAQLGTALMERTVLDGLCRFLEMPFHQVILENRLGVHLEEVHTQLRGVAVKDFLKGPPLSSLGARHTVGLADPLTDEEIPEEDRADDGLPQSLLANIRYYGLNHFKVKLWGKLERDRDRLRELTSLLEKEAPADYRVTIDGNEQYPDIETFREHFQEHLGNPGIAGLFEHLLFIEQPIHRDHALDDTVRRGFENWPEAPPVIIDESDAGLGSLPRALVLGYAGTSHKNCKGIVKSLANRALIELRGGIMSAEDLANLGPVALLQDLAMVALLRIEHVERNGHHYFAGLSMFPEELQRRVVEAHPDLYEFGERGFARLRIADGEISMSSINEAASFGVGVPVEAVWKTG